MSKLIPKQYISKFDISTIPKNYSILNNPIKDLFKSLTTYLDNRDIPNSISTAVELHLSGYHSKLIQILINYYYNEINIKNIPLLPFIDNFIRYYSSIDPKIIKIHPLIIVNDQVIRNFLVFFITICCMSPRNKIAKLPKIDSDDFNLTNQIIISKNLQLANQFIKPDDPKEIIIPISEICMYLSDQTLVNRDVKPIYWLSWLLGYEKQCHKNNLIVTNRVIDDVDDKFHNDFIWIIWSILIYFSNELNKKWIKYLLRQFTVGFSKSNKKTRSNIIIFAFTILINSFNDIDFEGLKLDEKLYREAIKNTIKSNIYYQALLNKIS